MKFPVDIAGVARFILSPQCNSIVMLTGAGVSVASVRKSNFKNVVKKTMAMEVGVPAVDAN